MASQQNQKNQGNQQKQNDEHGHERLDGGPDRRLAENREPGVNKDGSLDHRFEKRASEGDNSDPDAPSYKQPGKIEQSGSQGGSSGKKR